MKIQKIKEAFELTKDITNKNYVLISLLARKLKIDELDLMSFIKNNSDLFYTETIWTYKTKKVKNNIAGRYYWSEDVVKNKNLGLGIKTVYLSKLENYRTDEWLQKQIKDKAKYLHISEMDNYGYIQGYYLSKDKEDAYRTHLWRNTAEKLNRLKQENYLHSGSTVYGGFGDSYTAKYEYTISPEKINQLNELGWTFNNFKPLSK
jgi:hypothetical protein